MGRYFTYVVLLAWMGALSRPAQAVDWAIGTFGGGGVKSTYPPFFRDAQLFRKRLSDEGVSEGRGASFFGIEKNGKNQVCYGEFDLEKNKRGLKKLLRKFEKTPSSLKCSDGASEVLTYLLARYVSGGEKRVLCPKLSETQRRQWSRGSTRENLKQAMKNAIEKSAKGDHLTLNLNDHGLQRRLNWTVDFGSDEDAPLTSDEVADWVSALLIRGVHVHLDVQACFGGGFATVVDRMNPRLVCTTSLADADSVGWAGDAQDYSSLFLSRHSSQIESFFCAAAGGDPRNHPMTSLDLVVDHWEQKKEKPRDLGICRRPSVYEEMVGACAPVVDTLEREAELRSELLKAYAELAEKPAKECEKLRLPEPEKSLSEVLMGELGEMRPYLELCVQELLESRSLLSTSKMNQELLAELFKIPRGAPMPKADPVRDMIARHKEFLQKAGLEDLRKFKDAFCCLSYDRKKKRAAELCGD